MRWTILVLGALHLLGCKRDGGEARTLSLTRMGKLLPPAELERGAAAESLQTVETFDPYYQGPKRFRALPLGPLLSAGFQQSERALAAESFVLRARDGYAVPIEGSVLLDGSAYLALDDVDVPGFAPIGPRQVSPAPAYLIWKGDDHRDLQAHPRPWQLVAVEIVDPASLYPQIVPRGEAEDSLAMQGYRTFRGHCVRCHAINREGGSVGPELNVPQSIVEYRPEPQIRAYIRNPLTFRYGAMPANPELSEQDLDGLIAYFHAMSAHKHDPAHGAAP